MGRCGYFLFFSCSWAGEREEASKEVVGGAGSSKNRGRGGVYPRRRRGRGKGVGGMSVGRGGGLNISSGPKCPPRRVFALLGCTPRGSCNNTLLRRVLRRFSNSKCFLEGFLEGAL